MTSQQNPPFPFEIPIFSPSAARRAASLGASRVELNRARSYAAGGLTPSLAELAAALRSRSEAPRVPVRVMIRPRGKPQGKAPVEEEEEPDFIYTPGELQQMREAIAAFKASGLLDAGRGDGFVFGVLRRRQRTGTGGVIETGSGVEVDPEHNGALVRLAAPFACVFHRAFDDVVSSSSLPPSGRAGSPPPSGREEGEEGTETRPEGGLKEAWEEALETVISSGFAALLTSGGRGSAPDPSNAATLRRVIDRARGRIEVVVGGGVRSVRMASLAGALGLLLAGSGSAGTVVSFHSSCLRPGGADDEIDEREVEGMVKQLRLLGGS